MSSVTSRRAPRLLAITLPLAATAAALLPAAGNAAAYNVGVKSLHFEGVADACLPDQALPCTLDAGDGDANVLRVLQSEVDGYHQFTTLEGTSHLGGHLWVAAEIGAECRTSHHLDRAVVDGNLADNDLDGGASENDEGGLNIPAGVSWPQPVSVPEAKEMPVKRIALHIPIDAAFDSDNPLVGYFPTAQDVIDAGEAEIERRIDGGMSPAEARAIPYELNTTITVRATVECRFNGLVPAVYFKRKFASIPLRIDYLPVEVSAPVGDLPPAVDDVTQRARVTDAELVVIPDAADPCTLHLSGVISTDRETDVDYRFVNPYGQPSNTYSLHVDQTQVAMVDRTVDVPHADVVDFQGELAPTEGPGEIGGLADEGTDLYSGTYELEIMSPNHLVAADGFTVPYCEVGDPAIDPPADDVVAEPDPTHSDPTVPHATVPASVVTPTTTTLPSGSAIPVPPTARPTTTSSTTSTTTSTTIPPVATVAPVVIGVLVAPTTTGG